MVSDAVSHATTLQLAAGRLALTVGRTKNDAVPGRLRNPFWSSPKAFPRFGPKAVPGGWRGLTPRWPRSLRLGSASRNNIGTSGGEHKTPAPDVPGVCEKKRGAGSRHRIVYAAGRRVFAPHAGDDRRRGTSPGTLEGGVVAFLRDRGRGRGRGADHRARPLRRQRVPADLPTATAVLEQTGERPVQDRLATRA